jgi:hypothetical protein
MESKGEHKRDMSLLVYWIVIGLGLGIVIGSSTVDKEKGTSEWVLCLTSGLLLGVGMAIFATKPGVDQ